MNILELSGVTPEKLAELRANCVHKKVRKRHQTHAPRTHKPKHQPDCVLGHRYDIAASQSIYNDENFSIFDASLYAPKHIMQYSASELFTAFQGKRFRKKCNILVNAKVTNDRKTGKRQYGTMCKREMCL